MLEAGTHTRSLPTLCTPGSPSSRHKQGRKSLLLAAPTASRTWGLPGGVGWGQGGEGRGSRGGGRWNNVRQSGGLDRFSCRQTGAGVAQGQQDSWAPHSGAPSSASLPQACRLLLISQGYAVLCEGPVHVLANAAVCGRALDWEPSQLCLQTLGRSPSFSGKTGRKDWMFPNTPPTLSLSGCVTEHVTVPLSLLALCHRLPGCLSCPVREPHCLSAVGWGDCSAPWTL